MRISTTLALLAAAALGLSNSRASDQAFKVTGTTAALWNFGPGSAGGVADEASTGIELAPRQEGSDQPLQEVEGKFGKALFFPGNAALSGTKGTIDTPKEVTLEVWIKLDQDGDNTNRGIFQYAGYAESGFRLDIGADGLLAWLIEDGSKEIALHSTLKVPLDEWVHVAGTYDGATMKIYINGELDAEKAVEGANPQGTGSPLVGLISAEGPPYFRGAIQAIRISNVALTEFDIK